MKKAAMLPVFGVSENADRSPHLQKAAMLPVFSVPENTDRSPHLRKSGNVAGFRHA